MGIHGDKSQQERDWVLNGKWKHQLSHFKVLSFITQSNDCFVVQSSSMERRLS